MKTILLLALISLSFCEKFCDDVEDISGIKDCENLKINETNGYRCCFFNSKYEEYGKKEEYKGCGSVTKEQYENITDYIKALKEEDELDYLDIDCHSNYIKIAFLALLFILF